MIVYADDLASAVDDDEIVSFGVWMSTVTNPWAAASTVMANLSENSRRHSGI